MKKLSLLMLCFALGCGLGAMSLRAEDTSAVAKTPEIDHMVYLSFLPDPEELMADAKSGGLVITRLDKTADRVVVTYKYPDGHSATLGYALLGSARNTDRVATRRIERMEQVEAPVTTSTTEVVYVDRPYSTRVVYRDSYDNFWPPLVLGLGLGWATSWHGGHYYGGYHGGYHGGWHGGGRRH